MHCYKYLLSEQNHTLLLSQDSAGKFWKAHLIFVKRLQNHIAQYLKEIFDSVHVHKFLLFTLNSCVIMYYLIIVEAKRIN